MSSAGCRAFIGRPVLNSSQLADHVELNQLAYRYAAALDSCDVEAFLSVFLQEARLTTFPPGSDQPLGVSTGHAELANVPTIMRERFTRTAHFLTNHLIHLDGDRATGSLLCMARHYFANRPVGTDLLAVIRYLDRYERRENCWFIADREIRFHWSETHTTLNDDQVVGMLLRA